jgi:hypothetical protein
VEVTKAHWAKLARTTGLDEDRVVTIATSLARRVTETMGEVYADLPTRIANNLTDILTHTNANMLGHKPSD